ncbi:MAG: hypothetical protein OXC07_13230 [Kistimonas sp.]|nr:hypothetical protein [Kistimonas sp.]
MYDSSMSAGKPLYANTQARTPNAAQDQYEGRHEGRQVKPLAQPQPACCHKRTTGSPFAFSAPGKQLPLQEPCLDWVAQTGSPCPDLSDPDLPINCPIPNFIPLEKQVPSPPFTPRLKEDLHLTTDFQADNSLTFIKEQLAERRRVEEKGEEFVFAPLMVTLENMQTFIKHIEAGKQFEEPLTQEESAALKRIGQQTAKLVAAENPLYKRTLRLAVSLMLLCEIITQRLVLKPLHKEQPRLSEEIYSHYVVSYLRKDSDNELWLLAALPLTAQHNPDEEQALPVVWRHSNLYKTLFQTVTNQNLLLYPSFHPLTVADFCRFGHLPLHPVGLITDYVMGADSRLMTPLAFAEHDLQHMEQLIRIGDPDHQPTSPAEAALCSCAKRLDWRCLLLDKVPAPVAPLVSKPALQLFLFLLFHEENPRTNAGIVSLRLSAFSWYLSVLTDARTTKRDAYESIYWDITTNQTAMTVLWAIRLWSCWMAADCQLSQQQLQDCAQTFIDKDVPRLEQHLKFFSEHRVNLRLLFAQRCVFQSLDEHQAWKLGGQYGPGGGPIHFFHSHSPKTGLRNTERSELVYFEALRSPANRCAMEEQTRARLPEGTGSEPDTPTEGTGYEYDSLTDNPQDATSPRYGWPPL